MPFANEIWFKRFELVGLVSNQIDCTSSAFAFGHIKQYTHKHIACMALSGGPGRVISCQFRFVWAIGRFRYYTFSKGLMMNMSVHKQLSTLKVELQWYNLAQDKENLGTVDCHFTHTARS